MEMSMNKKLPKVVEVLIVVGLIAYCAVILVMKPPVVLPTVSPKIEKLLDDPRQNITDLNHDFSKDQ